MGNIEVESFVTKFRHLCHAGFNATLTFEAANGKASVFLKSELGVVKPPFPDHLRHHQSQPHRGPAYWRCQERRKAAAAAKVAVEEASLATVSIAEEVTENDLDYVPLADKARDHFELNQAAQADEKDTEEAEKTTEEVSFSCELCNFTSNWENGLRIHLCKKHSKIEQLDGNASIDSED